MKLHLGCGTRRPPGEYLNIDSRKEVNPDIVCKVGDLLEQVEADGAEEIYMCHVLEHFSDTADILQVCESLLRYHGVLRLAVPHMSNLMRAYCNGGVSLSRISGLIWGRQDYPENFHLTGWDFETLANDLREAGFYDVQLWDPTMVFGLDYHDFSYAQIWSESGVCYAASLNVEALRI